MQVTDILVKVFSHYPSEEIWQFLKRERINDSTIHLGLFQFIFSSGFARTSSEIDGKSSTLSFLLISVHGADGEMTEDEILILCTMFNVHNLSHICTNILL